MNTIEHALRDIGLALSVTHGTMAQALGVVNSDASKGTVFKDYEVKV